MSIPITFFLDYGDITFFAMLIPITFPLAYEELTYPSALFPYSGRFEYLGRVSTRRKRDQSRQLMSGQLLAAVPADGRQHVENHTLVDLLGELLEESLWKSGSQRRKSNRR
jgi:hypothetical protein